MQQRSLCVIVTIRSSLCFSPSLYSSSKSSRVCVCVNAKWPKTKVIKKSRQWEFIGVPTLAVPIVHHALFFDARHVHSHPFPCWIHPVSCERLYRLSSSRRAEYKPYVNRVFVVSNYLFTCVCVSVQRRWQRLMYTTPLLFDLMPFSRSQA